MSDVEQIKRPIILIGLSGSGKSSLGQAVAQKLSLPFIDTDAEIERRLALPIPIIFEQHGEAFFRDIESTVLKEILKRQPSAVIATGGGAAVRQQNVNILRENGLVIFIDRPPKKIIADIACDGSRPLVTNTEALYKMAQERRPAYVAAAHIILQNNGSFDTALADLLAAIQDHNRLAEFNVIGDPIGHTYSPAIHNAVFSALGFNAQYTAQRVPQGQLAAFLEHTRNSSVRGFNVTIPHKQDIIPLLDEITDEARLCNAVNTVVVRGHKFFGYNTDMDGLLLSLQHAGYAYHGRTVMILGAGGAASGIAYKAAREGAKKIAVLSRNKAKAAMVADIIRATAPVPITADEMTPEKIESMAQHTDILINATPLGMHGIAEDFTEFNFLRRLPSSALVYDLVYNPDQTQLLKHALALGFATQNGLGMLIFQALLADELFLNRVLNKEHLYKIAKGVFDK